VGAGPDPDQGIEETVPEGTEDTPVPIPEAARGPVATGGTEEDTTPGTTGEKRELLEIAKANAAKALGTENIVLPASLKVRAASKETSNIKKEHEDSGESDEQPGRLTEAITKSGMERATPRSISFSPNNTMAKPVQQKPASHVVKEPSISPGREDDKKGSPYGQWVPVKKEEKKFLNLSPKYPLFRAR
ncbi:UNVERIFIED_CONTAM: hypothetical protein H355_000661, partial [Colinus virginianus]